MEKANGGKNKHSKASTTEGITPLLTLEDEIQDNSIWCGTFQLIWNDLKNKIVGNNIVFINDKDNKYVNELNQESFNELMINDNYYYKNYGYMTIELKDKIINDLKNKFNEKSDILERFSFSKNSKDYFLYSMLVRNFKFQEPFDIRDEAQKMGILVKKLLELMKIVNKVFLEMLKYYFIKMIHML